MRSSVTPAGCPETLDPASVRGAPCRQQAAARCIQALGKPALERPAGMGCRSSAGNPLRPASFGMPPFRLPGGQRATVLAALIPWSHVIGDLNGVKTMEGVFWIGDGVQGWPERKPELSGSAGDRTQIRNAVTPAGCWKLVTELAETEIKAPPSSPEITGDCDSGQVSERGHVAR